MSGKREKDWGKAKKFREGQSLQTLDDLFFDYIALAKKLQPKVVIAENVKGMLMGNAKSYVRRIKTAFEKAGYIVQLFLLNAATMGVPQKRERVFFVCKRKDLKYNNLKLSFEESLITFGEYRSDKGVYYPTRENQKLMKHAKSTDKTICDIKKRLYNKISSFSANIVHDHAIVPTITGQNVNWRHCDRLGFTKQDYILSGSFPLDFDFKTEKELHAKYYIGMSVPPVMTAQIAHQIYLQWLKRN